MYAKLFSIRSVEYFGTFKHNSNLSFEIIKIEWSKKSERSSMKRHYGRATPL